MQKRNTDNTVIINKNFAWSGKTEALEWMKRSVGELKVPVFRM